ncbi:hypothetical protein QFC19_004458 [Naganishia cerealis]|uniref:Uncharacterized protein n=1 Tax=Naganishia cerealis TaxID=610337 RepID=A0ACC2VV80_9TREE|nr:hypothetical protein QFC19_004458 [Naganishia cerealis]
MSKLRGLEKDDADVRYSKTLAYLLRHGAEKQGLPMRKDGYVRVVDILEEPNLKSLSFSHLHHLVESNNKKRFVLFYGYDPSAKRPERKKKKQGQSKQALTLSQEPEQGVGKSAEPQATQQPEETEELPLVPVEAPTIESYVPEEIAAPQQKTKPSPRSTTLGSNASEPEWFIRAAQGHSIQTVTTEHLEPIANADEEGLQKVGEMVHGSKAELWDSIRNKGLARGTRQHIHLARARSGATSGPRANSSLYIYLSLPTLLAHHPPIPVFISTNNVILTPGNSEGVIPATMFQKVVRLRREPHRAGPEHSQQEPRSLEAATPEVEQEKPKRDRKHREKPRFVEEIIWEGGAPVDPPRIVETNVHNK